MIRKFFDRFDTYDPNKWHWQPYTYAHNSSLEEQKEWNDLYMKTRARRSNDADADKKIPDFHSAERDADQFGLREVTITDIFGLKWTGHKGTNVTIGAPDFEGHLYFDLNEIEDEDYDWVSPFDEDVGISVYSLDNPPPEDVCGKFNIGYPRFRTEWIDIVNIIDLEYHYYVENHLFKDSRIEIVYSGGQHITLYDNSFIQFVYYLKKFDKHYLLDKLYKQMNEHFEALKNSEHEEERDYYPNCTAEEYFEERIQES